MIILAKSVLHPFIVKKDKAREILQEKRDDLVLQKILAKANKIEKNMIK